MKWEYKTLKLSTHNHYIAGKLDESAFDNALNELGLHGWELVAIFPLSQTIGETRDTVAAFKRQVGS